MSDIKYLEIDKRLENELKLLNDELYKICYDVDSIWNDDKFNIDRCRINLEHSLKEEINLREVRRYLFARLLDETIKWNVELDHDKDIVEIPLLNSRYFVLKLDKSCRMLQFGISSEYKSKRKLKCIYENDYYSYMERFANDLVWKMLVEFEFSLGNNKAMIEQEVSDKNSGRGYYIIPKTPIDDMYNMMCKNKSNNISGKSPYECEGIIDEGISAMFSILLGDTLWIDKIIPLLDNMFDVMVFDTNRHCARNYK